MFPWKCFILWTFLYILAHFNHKQSHLVEFYVTDQHKVVNNREADKKKTHFLRIFTNKNLKCVMFICIQLSPTQDVRSFVTGWTLKPSRGWSVLSRFVPKESRGVMVSYCIYFFNQTGRGKTSFKDSAPAATLQVCLHQLCTTRLKLFEILDAAAFLLLYLFWFGP